MSQAQLSILLLMLFVFIAAIVPYVFYKEIIRKKEKAPETSIVITHQTYQQLLWVRERFYRSLEQKLFYLYDEDSEVGFYVLPSFVIERMAKEKVTELLYRVCGLIDATDFNLRDSDYSGMMYVNNLKITEAQMQAALEYNPLTVSVVVPERKETI